MADVAMPRLFVAAWPDDAVASALSGLPRPEKDGVRWSPPSNWHVTLRFLGEASVDAVVDRLAAATLPAATVTFGPTVERLGARVLMIPVAGAEALARSVRDATAGLGRRDQFDFLGHLTLARTKPDAPSTMLGTAFDATMHVRHVALVRSRLGPTGSTYETVATFDLDDSIVG